MFVKHGVTLPARGRTPQPLCNVADGSVRTFGANVASQVCAKGLGGHRCPGRDDNGCGSMHSLEAIGCSDPLTASCTPAGSRADGRKLASEGDGRTTWQRTAVRWWWGGTTVSPVRRTDRP